MKLLALLMLRRGTVCSQGHGSGGPLSMLFVFLKLWHEVVWPLRLSSDGVTLSVTPRE